MEAKTKDLWVFVETKEDGSAKNVGIELLNPGRELANQQGGKLVAVIVGNNLDAAINEASAAGADQVIAVEGPEYADYTTDAYVTAMAHLIEKYGPTTMLIGATPNGRDMGPRLSSRLQTGLTADCTALAIDEATGCVAWTRPSCVQTIARSSALSARAYSRSPQQVRPRPRSSARTSMSRRRQSVPRCSRSSARQPRKW